MSAPVSRETVERLLARWGVPAPDAAEQVEALLAALEAEPDPPTTVREPSAALDIHVADSLSGLEIAELRDAATIADIGAGAGFPGLALALAIPAARVDLIEATGRKCAVIDRLAAAAGLAGRARAIPARAEEWAARDGAAAYEAVTARALAQLAVLVEYAAPLLIAGGAFIAWKGDRDADEEHAGRAAATQVGLEETAIVPVRPFRGSRERHLYVYSKVRETPSKFPRRAGMAAKRPLSR